jgi:arylsulfatase A-like enzyme
MHYIRSIFKLSAALLLFSFTVFSSCTRPGNPNVVIFYIDDLGYGDVSCYGATEITTPNIDALAASGLMFTNGHCPSATCTPSRYAMLTGEYAWRQEGTGIAAGNQGMIIEPGRTTWASIMKKAGYTTAVVGKWHLGLGPEGGPDWNTLIEPGPESIGFDYSYLVPATGDRVPCVYVEDGRVVGLDPEDPIDVSYSEPILEEPLGKEHPELLKMHPSHGHDRTIINGISRIGDMSGGKSAWWVDEDMADTLTVKALEFIERNRDKPFFLYFATHDIHVPRVPHPRFAGTSGLGPRGDAILQMDWCIGEIMDKLDRLGLTENTLVIFTSDNGPVVDDGYRDQAVKLLGLHEPSGPLRGGKYSAFEGGTRIPFIVSWPSVVEPGGRSDALMSQVDYLTTFAALLGVEVDEGIGPDSRDMLDALLGKVTEGRDHLVEHSVHGTLSLISGDWKYIEPSNAPSYAKYTDIELGNDTIPQLYNLNEDLGETNNLAGEEPGKLKEMEGLLERIRNE